MKKSPSLPPNLTKLRQIRSEIIALAEKYGAEDVRVFGSVARGEATLESDIDFLVRFRQGSSLYELSGLWQELQKLAGHSISLVTEGGLKERFKTVIEKDLVAL